MKTIVIEVAADGSITVEGQGFKGAECEKATKALEEALGKTGERKKKPEWYQQTTGRQTA